MSSRILTTIPDRSLSRQLGERLPRKLQGIEEKQVPWRRPTTRRRCKQSGFFTVGIGLALLGVFGGISAGLQTSAESDAQSMATGPEVEAVASVQDPTTNKD